jgi:hypothetical protein
MFLKESSVAISGRVLSKLTYLSPEAAADDVIRGGAWVQTESRLNHLKKKVLPLLRDSTPEQLATAIALAERYAPNAVAKVALRSGFGQKRARRIQALASLKRSFPLDYEQLVAPHRK